MTCVYTLRLMQIRICEIKRSQILQPLHLLLRVDDVVAFHMTNIVEGQFD
jgi:hypothetical protein